MKAILCFLLIAVSISGRVSAAETATAVASVTAGFVSGISVISGGSGYVAEPAVTLAGGGGTGATAKAILTGDKVSAVIVLTAGSGYASPPMVTIDPPPQEVQLRVKLVRKLTVQGLPGTRAQVEVASDASGPWASWTNAVASAEGTIVVDVSADAPSRFYRVVPDRTPLAPAGFVWIPPGTFVMGSPITESGRQTNEVQHVVTLTRGFWMRARELVESDYQAVLGLDRQFTWGASWEEAVEYCHRLTEQERAAGRISYQEVYRLPTEAEWEYAARAGTTGPRYSDQFSAVPNAWGLWDMLGGLEEWCSDWLGDYPTGPVTDPQGPATGTWRVLRGGMSLNPNESLRSASRSGFFPMNGFGYYRTLRPVLSSVW